MNISKNSWHWKILKGVKDDYELKELAADIERGRVSSCQYRGKVLAAFIFSIFSLFFALFGIVVIGFFLTSLGYLIAGLMGFVPLAFENEGSDWPFFLTTIGSLVLFFTVVLGAICAIARAKNKIKSGVKGKIDSGDSVVISYFKDKKSKFCPTVSFVKERKDDS